MDRNPIEWPPRFIIDAGKNNESVQAMKNWIRNLKEWIEANPESKFHDEPSYFDLNRQEYVSSSDRRNATRSLIQILAISDR